MFVENNENPSLKTLQEQYKELAAKEDKSFEESLALTALGNIILELSKL